MFIKNKILFLVALGLGFLSTPSWATVVYNVSSTSKINCTSGGGSIDHPHGLWTATDAGSPSCTPNFYDIDSGSTFTIFDNAPTIFAELDATATNSDGITADIFIRFTDFSETFAPIAGSPTYKQEGGLPYLPANDSAALAAPNNFDIDAFTGIDFGVSRIIIDGTTYNFDAANEFVGDHAFQFGMGANAKVKTEFGGSAWIQPIGRSSHHWDLNLSFTPVPEPSALVLMGLGIIGLGFARKKKN